MSQLECKNLILGYDGKAVVNGVNFSVNAGDFLCIIGENGSGKSTLMKTLLGLIPPLEGSVLTGDGLKQNEIGYLPQQTLVQKDFPASVEEIVISGCQGRCGLRPFYTKAEKQLALKNMQKMNVVDIKKRCFRELSGGQQQRVLLARALCATGKLLLLDEPASGLDVKVSSQMYGFISEINRNDKITVIMISHDIAAALKYATHILYVGKELFFGTTSQYLQSDIAKRFSVSGGGEHK